MTIAAWILSVLGLALAWLIALASGMKTVPRFTNTDLLIACLLPCLAIFLALLAMNLGEHERSGARQLSNGGALLLALATVGFVCQSWAFQPSTPPVAKAIRERIGLGDPRWKPDTERWASGDQVVVAEQHHTIRPQEGESRLVLGEASREGLTWRRLRYQDGPGRENTVVISSSAILATLHQSAGLIHGNSLFMGMGDHLLALSLPDLAERWQITLPVGSVYTLFTENDALLAVCSDGALCFDGETGQIHWSASMDPHYATGHFQCANGILIMDDTQGGQHRFSVETGDALESE